MNRGLWRQILVALGVLATIVVNVLANALPINGQNTGEISDRFDIYFVPAGYVFSIWGLIYLGLLAFAVYQGLPAQRANPRLEAISGPFLLSCAANIVWIFLWHYNQFPPTLAAMGVLLVSLIGVYLLLGTGRTAAPPAERWMVGVPFSIYLGWITVATVANATQVLFFTRWGAWGISAEVWALIMLGVAAALAGLMTATRRDVAYLAVLVWAFVGIALKHASVPPVAVGAWVASALVALMIIGSAALSVRRSTVPAP